MTRTLLALAALLAGLLWVERSLAARAGEARASRSRVGHLIAPEERAQLSLSALRLEHAGQPLLTYGRVRGRWRQIETHLAPADVSAIEGLVKGLLDAQGFVVSDEPSEAALWGVATPEGWRVSLCGPKVLEAPDGDVQLAVDLGASVPEDGGSFVRRRGSREVWAIDADPRSFLEPPVAGLPPLLEPYVVPRDWPGWGQGLRRIEVRRAEGERFVLERRPVEVTPDELRAGKPPWTWILAPGPAERPAAELPAHAFSLFLQRIPFVDVVDPARLEELGQASGELVLEGEDGSRLSVRLGAADAAGRALAWNDDTRTLFAVEAEVAPLALPGVQAFLEGATENPWDPWLRR